MSLPAALVMTAMALLPAHASAQGRFPSEGVPRHSLSITAGSAFEVDFDRPSTALGFEYGERVHRNVQVFALLSYADNLMSQRMRGHLVRAAAELSRTTGTTWEFRGRDRGLAFTVGGKVYLPIAARVRPYLGGGIGALNLKRRIHERDLGDVSDRFHALTGLTDGAMHAADTSATRGMAEAILGVGGVAGRAYIDVAYRYRRAFHGFDPLAFSQVTAGVGVPF